MSALSRSQIREDLRWDDGRGRVRPMDHVELYFALGLNPKRHLPDAGLAPQWVGNVLVTVDPRVPGTDQDAKRVWCSCAHCGKYLTAGKLHQHMEVHRPRVYKGFTVERVKRRKYMIARYNDKGGPFLSLRAARAYIDNFVAREVANAKAS